MPEPRKTRQELNDEIDFLHRMFLTMKDMCRTEGFFLLQNMTFNDFVKIAYHYSKSHYVTIY